MVDLYRAYGKAALAAAGLENSLMLLIALKKAEGKDDSIFLIEHRKLERKTLGALIRDAKSLSVFTDASDDNLNLILIYRNWMVHNIARDMLGYILQKDGNVILEKNLEELHTFFKGASEAIYQEAVKLSEKRGIKQEYVTELVKLAFEEEI